MTNSDAETVVDAESPLSPCLWTPKEVVEDQCEATGKQPSRRTPASRFDCTRPRQHHELQLSPASQLNVLSHISELADAPSREPGVMSRVSMQQTERSNVWGAALQTTKRKETSRPVAAARPKRRKNGQKPMQSQADRLATDMLDWETCSEGDLFALEDEMEDDQWVYEEIDDSEFDGESTAS